VASATWPMARGAYVPAQSDTVNLPSPSTAGIWVSAAGDLQVTMSSGAVVLIAAIPAGTFLGIEVIKIWDTGTTLTNAQILVQIA
jgi:hypothetical protein